jgi:hypothetical protein
MYLGLGVTQNEEAYLKMLKDGIQMFSLIAFAKKEINLL